MVYVKKSEYTSVKLKKILVYSLIKVGLTFAKGCETILFICPCTFAEGNQLFHRFSKGKHGDAIEPKDVVESLGKSSVFFLKGRACGITSSVDTGKLKVERRRSGGIRYAFGGPEKYISDFRSLCFALVCIHHHQQASNVYTLSSMASV